MSFKIYFLLVLLIIRTSVASQGCKRYIHDKGNVGVMYCNSITLAELPSLNATARVWRFTIMNSNISTIPASAFDKYKNHSVEYLDLKANEIKSISPGAFSMLENLTRLTLKDNNLEIIPRDAFNKNLRYLILMKNSIGYIDSYALSLVDRLTHLDLSYNMITTIGRENFKLPQLRELYLNSNEISSIHKDAFLGLHLLAFLFLSKNKIQELEAGIFRDLGSLRFLKLDTNRIEKIPRGTFDGLNKLTYLTLAENKLITLESYHLKPLSTLEHLDLRHNLIRTLGPNTFILPKLRNLHINANDISSIDKDAFLHLHKLNRLVLSHNIIEVLSPGVFRDLKSLLYLDLKSNNIERVLEHTFDDLKNLRTLLLSWNELKTLEDYNFNSLPYLAVLAFDHNHIRDFNASNVFKNFTKLREVYIGHNPWKCEVLLQVREVCKTQSIMIMDDHKAACK